MLPSLIKFTESYSETVFPDHAFVISLVRIAKSDSYCLPSEDTNFSCTIFSYNSKPSSFNLILRSDQYLLGIELPVNISMTSIIEKYHFSSAEFHSTLTFLFSNNFIE